MRKNTGAPHAKARCSICMRISVKDAANAAFLCPCRVCEGNSGTQANSATVMGSRMIFRHMLRHVAPFFSRQDKSRICRECNECRRCKGLSRMVTKHRLASHNAKKACNSSRKPCQSFLMQTKHASQHSDATQWQQACFGAMPFSPGRGIPAWVACSLQQWIHPQQLFRHCPWPAVRTWYPATCAP